MSELSEQICRILRKSFRCSCVIKPHFCLCVADLSELILEKCEEETSKEG